MSSILDEVNNPFWQFSLKLYKNKQIESALINLQEQYDLNINCILFALWLAYVDIQLQPNEFQDIIKSVEVMQSNITKVIRKARKSVKLNQSQYPDMFYQNLLQIELESEALQQQKLYQLASKFKQTEIKINSLLAKQYLKWLFNINNINYYDNLIERLINLAI
ncbi:MAG: TIGR02444 family protein [Gammaproteobacteria bacterium]|nr:MAG: TIGR02444 family protein [Gammaproteobacteria bacterium]UTW41679.1 TIGR02444 family protein [bacterium SCSIO 12844]